MYILLLLTRVMISSIIQELIVTLLDFLSLILRLSLPNPCGKHVNLSFRGQSIVLSLKAKKKQDIISYHFHCFMIAQSTIMIDSVG